MMGARGVVPWFGRLWRRDRAAALCLLFALGSTAIWGLAWAVGAHQPPEHTPPGYKTYFERFNWWPIPFVFLGAALGLWLTWRPMLGAWAHLQQSGVLQRRDGRASKADGRAVSEFVRSRGPWAFAVALILSVAMFAIDVVSRKDLAALGGSYADQLSYACDDAFFLVKWVFESTPGPPEGVAVCSRLWHANLQGNAPIGPPLPDAAFIAVMLGQQFLVMLMITYAMARLFLHTLLFAVFERTRIAKGRGLFLHLNANSPVGEFGLERWNFALNNFYWATIPLLAAVFITRSASVSTAYTLGQEALALIVPVCMLGPMIATIIARQARLPQVWRQVDEGDPSLQVAYRRQALWPLDRNWTSKLGILLAFALAAVSIGYQLDKLLFL